MTVATVCSDCYPEATAITHANDSCTLDFARDK